MKGAARHWRTFRAALAHERARSAKVLRTDESDFLPAALEIVERPVSPTSRVTAWMMLSGLAVAILWLTFGKVDVVASASGKIVPGDAVKLVQPAEAGIVRAILVRDGQRVARGQALVELDPTISAAETTQARRALESAELDSARNLAILSALDGHGLNLRVPAGTSPELAATQRQLARAQLDQINAMAAVHMADQQASSSARAEAAGQAAKLAETLPLLDEQIAANEKMLEKGYVSKLKVIEMRRQRLSTARDREIALDTIARASAQMRSSSDTVAQARAEARAQVLTDLSKAQSEARQRREELTKAGQRSSLQRLVSPVNGTVTQLAVHTIGGVVEAAKPIIVIVPIGGTLVLEAKVLNRDVGFVHGGEAVSVKLEAFPFTRFGTVPGRVESVSSDAVEDEKLGLVYTARISLGRASIDRDGERAALTPGMAATADVKTGRRSILSYLVSPINEARLDAGHER